MVAGHLILLIAALILFVLAAIGLPTGRYNLGWFGAACLTASWLLLSVARA